MRFVDSQAPQHVVIERLVCSWLGHHDVTVAGTYALKNGAEMKQCARCHRTGWVVLQ